jgi:hypothetical protein
MGFIDFNNFEKDTVILNSDRVILNSKDDSVFILSKKTVGVSAVEAVHFDIGLRGSTNQDNKFVINAPNIQLGLPENGVNEPIAKAESVIAFITDIIGALDAFSASLSKSNALGVGVSGIPNINVAAATLKGKLGFYKTKYTQQDSPIRSKISKTI